MPERRGVLDTWWRSLLVLVGAALAGLGVWAVFVTDQEAGTATLIAGGLVLIVVGAMGSLLKVKFGDLEFLFAESGAGNDEAAQDALRLYLSQSNPDDAHYLEALLRALHEAAAAVGTQVRSISGIPGVNAVVAGSRIGVDVRPGTAFKVDRVQTIHKSLLDPTLPVFDALLTIVRADDGDDAVRSLRSMRFSRPHVVVGWREGASIEVLERAITEIRDMVADESDSASTSVRSSTRPRDDDGIERSSNEDLGDIALAVAEEVVRSSLDLDASDYEIAAQVVRLVAHGLADEVVKAEEHPIRDADEKRLRVDRAEVEYLNTLADQLDANSAEAASNDLNVLAEAAGRETRRRELWRWSRGTSQEQQQEIERPHGRGHDEV